MIRRGGKDKKVIHKDKDSEVSIVIMGNIAKKISFFKQNIPLKQQNLPLRLKFQFALCNYVKEQMEKSISKKHA